MMKTVFDRDEEMMRLVAQGLSRSSLADQLGLSVSSIDKRLAALKIRLGVSGRVELAMACARQIEMQNSSTPTERTDGHIVLSPTYLITSDEAQTPVPITAADLLDYTEYEALFSHMARLLARFGVRWLVTSHIRRMTDGSLAHIASRSSLHHIVPYDASMPVEANPTFVHAFHSWDPLPMDLQALRQSPAFHAMPDQAQIQTDAYIRSGFVRGIVFPLPLFGQDDRLVVSVIFSDMESDKFPAYCIRFTAPLFQSLMSFRNAHAALAKPTRHLDPATTALLIELMNDVPIDLACRKVAVGLRTGQRMLSDARARYAVTSNMALAKKVMEERTGLTLPF